MSTAMFSPSTARKRALSSVNAAAASARNHCWFPGRRPGLRGLDLGPAGQACGVRRGQPRDGHRTTGRDL